MQNQALGSACSALGRGWGVGGGVDGGWEILGSGGMLGDGGWGFTRADSILLLLVYSELSCGVSLGTLSQGERKQMLIPP